MRKIGLGFVFSVLLTGVTQAQEADLGRGIKAYTEADYRTAISVLEALDETTLRLDERVVLHKFLALSRIARRERERAHEEFIKLLMLEPDYELNQKEVAPSVRELFQKSRIARGAHLCDQGVEKYTVGRFQEAIPDLEQALRLNPHDTRASEFLKLTSNRVQETFKEEEEEIKCLPSRVWGELDAKSASCNGKDYSSGFQLPTQANRITLLYNKHHFGVGNCWKIVLYDQKGNELLVLDDASRDFAGRSEPSNSSRWRVVDLPETVTIGRVVMYAERGQAFKRFVGKRVNRDLDDELILGFEIACPKEAQKPGHQTPK